MSAVRKPKVVDPVSVQDAVAIFDLAATRTNENHQTKAWKILRAELERLRGYEEAAAAFAIEKAELRRSLQAMLSAYNVYWSTPGSVAWPIVETAREVMARYKP
jgi:hypothetical protein